MLRLSKTTTLLAVYLMSFSASVLAQEIKSYQSIFLGDVGYANVDRFGNRFIVMNPLICRRLGKDLCSFFRAHEIAHHKLRHFSRRIPVQQKEAEADRYAASVVSPSARGAAQRFFASGHGASPQHGTSAARLTRVSLVRRTQPTTQNVLRASPRTVTNTRQHVATKTITQPMIKTVSRSANQTATPTATVRRHQTTVRRQPPCYKCQNLLQKN